MEFLYNFLNDESKVSVKLNLNKAQKMLTKMKKELPHLGESKNLGSLSLSRSSAVNLNHENGVQAVKNIMNEHLQNFYKYYKLETDMLALKNLIYKKNGEVKMDTILSRIDLLNALKAQYQQISYSDSYNAKSISELKQQDITRVAESLPTDYLSLNVIFYPQDEITKIINSISKEVNKLETERDYLNATTELTIELYKENVELLGL